MIPMQARYESAARFEEFVRAATVNAELWQVMTARARVSEAVVREVEAVSGHWHMLALVEDWCGDAINTVPVLAALADQAANLDLRVLSRDANPDLMNSHLTGASRSIPVVILLDSDYVERAWWGPRPGILQHWVTDAGRALGKEDRYREVRRWYARDRGNTTLRELVTLLRAVDVPAAA
jgi:hypothetical protein